MKLTLPALDVDLVVEHGRHEMKLKGTGTRLVAAFPSLFSLFHFARVLWPSRRHVPEETSLLVEWRRFRIPVKSAALPGKPLA